MASVTNETRVTALRDWFASVQPGHPSAFTVVAGDASFRRYFRASLERVDGPLSVILCDSPPETEKNVEFLALAKAFQAAGVRVPEVLAVDLERGFFALEDFGDELMLPALDEDSVDALYRSALALLLKLAHADLVPPALPRYDYALLAREMSLFPEWFLEGLLGATPDEAFLKTFKDLETLLCERALAQVQVPVHRDFHSRNLMLLPGGDLATIDFQDAVLGPVTYDPVSLLRDCYRRWPEARVRDWALLHRGNLADAGVPVPGPDDFLCDFDWMGLQRHIKVLGIFARLWLRDGKAGYLPDLPRVIGYVRYVLSRYADEPVLAEFGRYFEQTLMPLIHDQDWFTASERGGGT